MKRHGTGKLTLKNGTVITGKWKNGVLDRKQALQVCVFSSTLSSPLTWQVWRREDIQHGSGHGNRYRGRVDGAACDSWHDEEDAR